MRILGILLLFFLALNSTAQVDYWGPKASLNYSWADINTTFDNGGLGYSYLSKNADVGFNYGLYFRTFLVSNLYIQPEILVSQLNFTTEVKSLNLDTIRGLTLNKIDIPILIGWQFKEKNQIFLGPTYTKKLAKTPDEKGFFKDEVGKLFADGSWGFQVGLGRNLTDCFTVDIRYETNLSQLGSDIEIRGQTFDFDYRNHLVIIGLALNFKDK